jgi:hypothetical protein
VVDVPSPGGLATGRDGGEEALAVIATTDDAVVEPWDVPDPRVRAWQVFFPGDAHYRALERGAAVNHPPREGDVLVAWGNEDVALPDLEGWDGLVVTRRALPTHAALRSAGFSWIRRFVVLPSLGDPRWYLPVGDTRVTAAALSVYTPYRIGARIRKRGLQAAVRLGATRFLGDELLLAQRSMPALTQTAAQLYPGEGPRVILTAGRRERAFKLSAGILTADGRLRAIARICRTGEPRQALIANEAEMLRHLNARHPGDGPAPRLLFDGVRGDLYMTVQGAIAGRPGSRDMTNAHRGFLARLQEGGGSRPASESQLVRQLHVRADRWFPEDPTFQRLLAALDRDLAALVLPSVVVHGDFAPWNVRLERGQLRAFDWEYGIVDGLPHLDALHHEIQVGRLLDRWSTDRMTAELRAFAARDIGAGPGAALTITRLYLADRCLRMAEETGDSQEPDARRYLEHWARLEGDATGSGATTP